MKVIPAMLVDVASVSVSVVEALAFALVNTKESPEAMAAVSQLLVVAQSVLPAEPVQVSVAA